MVRCIVVSPFALHWLFSLHLIVPLHGLESIFVAINCLLQYIYAEVILIVIYRFCLTLQTQALFRIGHGEPPPIPDSLSRDAYNFIRKCVQVNPDDRPTASQLLEHPFVKRPLKLWIHPHSTREIIQLDGISGLKLAEVNQSNVCSIHIQWFFENCSFMKSQNSLFRLWMLLVCRLLQTWKACRGQMLFLQ